MLNILKKRIQSINEISNTTTTTTQSLVGKTVQIEHGVFKLIDVLSSEGGSAILYRAQAKLLRSGGSSAETCFCAVKVIEIPDDKELIKKAKTEVEVHRSLSKNCAKVVVGLIAAEIISSSSSNIVSKERKYRMYIALELMDGDLTMKSFRNSSSLEKMLEPFISVCDCLSVMHAQRLCHYDIKRENVLYSERENMYKVCDFGSVEFAPEDDKVYTNATERHRIQDEMKSKTTPAYRAPEMWDTWKFQKPPGTASDLWALGCFLHEIAYDELAFGDASEAMLRSLSGRGAGSRNAQAIQSKNDSQFPRKIDGIDALVRDLCKICPDERISAKEAKERALRIIKDPNDFPGIAQAFAVIETSKEEKDWIEFEPNALMNSKNGTAEEVVDPFFFSMMPPPPPRLPTKENNNNNNNNNNKKSDSLLDEISPPSPLRAVSTKNNEEEGKKDEMNTIKELKLLAKIERLERRIQEYQDREELMKAKLRANRTQLEQEREIRQSLEKKLGLTPPPPMISKNSSGSSLNDITPSSINNDGGERRSHSRSESFNSSMSDIKTVTAQHGTHRRSGSNLSLKASALEEMSMEKLANPMYRSRNSANMLLQQQQQHRRAVSLGGEFDLLEAAIKQGKQGLFSQVFKMPPASAKNKSVGMDKPYG